MVLLDVMLPKHDGYEVCQAIREFSDMPHHYADGQGRGHGQNSGPGVRRGRLHQQALQHPGGKSQDQGDHAPQRKEPEKPQGGAEQPCDRGGRFEDGYGEPPRVHFRTGDQPHRQGIRPSGASGAQPQQGVQPRGAVDLRVGQPGPWTAATSALWMFTSAGCGRRSNQAPAIPSLYTPNGAWAIIFT